MRTHTSKNVIPTNVNGLLQELVELDITREALIIKIKSEHGYKANKRLQYSQGKKLSPRNNVKIINSSWSKEKMGMVITINYDMDRVAIQSPSGHLLIRKSKNFTVSST